MGSVSASDNYRSHGMGGLVVFYSSSGQDPEQNKLLLLPASNQNFSVAKQVAQSLCQVWCSGSLRKAYFVILILLYFLRHTIHDGLFSNPCLLTTHSHLRI